MLYSSGTTGKPKGVWRPAPDEPVEDLGPADRAAAEAFGITPDSVYLSPAPLYHSAPITFLIQMGRIGAATVIMERFDPAESLAAIERYGVTHSQWVPTMFVRMLRLPDEERNRHDLSSHVFAIHGAGPCPIAVKEAMLDWWGPIIHEYYAGTEGAGMCRIGPEEWLEHKGSVGRSARGPVLIVDDDGNELPAGEVGQIWFANSSDFRYHGDETKTAEARRGAGGTFGDIGYLDDDGYLYLTDRKSFTINAGGVNIYPQEIEDVLLAHPAVHDVAVFGLPERRVRRGGQGRRRARPGRDRRRRPRRRAARSLPHEARRLQGPAFDRLRAATPPRAHRQTPQAPDPRPLPPRPLTRRPPA